MRRLFGLLLSGMLVLFAVATVDAQGTRRPRTQAQPKLPDETAEDVFKRLDTNHNGKLSWEEFKHFIGIAHGTKGYASKPKDAKDLADIYKRIKSPEATWVTLEEFKTLDTTNSDKKEEKDGKAKDKKEEKKNDQ